MIIVSAVFINNFVVDENTNTLYGGEGNDSDAVL